MSLRVANVTSMDEAGRRGSRIGTVAATVAILRLLGAERRPLGVNAIARQLGQTPSSCFNILKTLLSEDFVDFDPQGKLYTLGGGVITIARSALDPSSAFDLIRSRIELLADTWAVTVGLWRVQHNRIQLVGYVTGSKKMRIHLTVGQRLPMLIGSVGRCVAAAEQLIEAEITAGFNELRWEQAPTLAEYLEEVTAARARGWSVDRGHFVRGATTIAVPIFHPNGSTHYCLATTMFTGQYPEEQFPALAQEMQEIARWASSRLT